MMFSGQKKSFWPNPGKVRENVGQMTWKSQGNNFPANGSKVKSVGVLADSAVFCSEVVKYEKGQAPKGKVPADKNT